MLSHYVVFLDIYIYIYIYRLPTYIYIYFIRHLVCSIIEYFNQPVEQVKMQTMSKTTWRY